VDMITVPLMGDYGHLLNFITRETELSLLKTFNGV